MCCVIKLESYVSKLRVDCIKPNSANVMSRNETSEKFKAVLYSRDFSFVEMTAQTG